MKQPDRDFRAGRALMAIPGLAGARAAVVFFTLMALTGCGERHEWNQKVTVAVETPSGEVAGSSITHVEARGGGKRSFIHDGPSTGYEVDGEATIVDFGSGRYLFALLQGAGPGFGGRAQNIAGVALCPREMEKATAACFAHVEGLANGSSAAVQADNYPLLVTFDDINEPNSVKLVDPDDLDGAFGLCPDGTGLKDEDAPWRAQKMSWREWARWQASGETRENYLYGRNKNLWPFGWREQFDKKITPREKSSDCRSLKAISIEITDEKVTKGKVEKVLGWIATAEYIIPPELQPRYVKDQTEEQVLMPGDFIDWQTLMNKRGAE